MSRIARSILLAAGTCTCFGACSKKDDGPKAAASASPVSGCGADYADPQKEFCLKLPATYQARPPSAPDALYSESITFEGPDDRVQVRVGFTSSNFTTYEEQFKSDDEWIKSKKLESSGPMTGTGQWWSYDNDGYKSFKAIVKSNGNKAVFCVPTSTEAAAEVIAICKTLRAYPK